MPKFKEIEGCLIADRANIYKQKAQSIPVKKQATIVDRLTVVLKSKRWIEKNIREKFTIQDLSLSVGMSLSQLQRTFKAREGLSIVKYIQQRRVAHATQLLESTKYSVIDACQEVGLSSASTFSSIYKKIKGISPREVKKAESNKLK